MARMPEFNIQLQNTHPITAYLAYYQFKKDEYTVDIYILIRQLLRNKIELHSQQILPDKTNATLFFRGLPENYKVIIRNLINITSEKVNLLSKLIEINLLQRATELCEQYNTESAISNWNSALF